MNAAIETPTGMLERMEMTCHKIRLSDFRMQGKFVRKLRTELVEKIDNLVMKEERKSYFVHQINNALDISELEVLVKEVNEKQLALKGDLVFLSETETGLNWTIHSLN